LGIGGIYLWRSVKKVLIITYYWPPAGGAGVQRWLKMSKYLPEYGVEPIILTVDPEKGTYPQKDDSLVEEVRDDIRVYKTDSFEPLKFYGKIAGSQRVPYGGFSNKKGNSILARFLRGNLFIPDARKGWNSFAFRKAVEIINDHSIGTVITTGPPHSTHLIGLKLKKELGLKWVVDLRDPWTDIYYNKEMARTPWAKNKDLSYEKAVLSGADICITASEGFAELFNKKVEREYFVITNGFDDHSEESAEVPEPNQKLVISYTGTIAESYEPEVLLEVLKSLNRSFELRIAGGVSEKIRNTIGEFGLEESVQYLGYLPHKSALHEMKGADVLLLITPKVENAKGIIPGKLFEYLSTGNPILAIADDPDGDVTRILKENGAGRAFSRSNFKEILHFLGSPATKYDVPEKYHRRNLTGNLVKILER